MALVPLPDIDGDPRITRRDYRGKGAKITAKEVIRALVKVRYPANLAANIRRYYASILFELNGKNRHILDGQRIMVLIQDYDALLRCQPQYQQIKDYFLKYIDIHGLMDDEEEKKFKNLLMTFFLPLSCDNNPPHDDWIMMIISITVELGLAVLVSTGNAKDVEKLTRWADEVLNPKRTWAFYVNPWLFNRWLHVYRELIDRTRRFSLAHPTFLKCHPDTAIAAMNNPLPAVKKKIFNKLSKYQSTLRATREVSENTYGSSVGPGKGGTVATVPFHDISYEILVSYILSRIQPEVKKGNCALKFIQEIEGDKRHDFSQGLMGKALTSYGELIAATTDYKAIFKVIWDKYCEDRDKYGSLVIKYIFPPNQLVVYDRIMTVFLLASDMINALLIQGKPEQASRALGNFNFCLKQTEKMKEVVDEGLFRLHHFFSKTKTTSFDLLYDRSLIAGPPPSPATTSQPRDQNLPLVSEPAASQIRGIAAMGPSAKTAATSMPSTSQKPATQVNIFAQTTGSTSLAIGVSTAGRKRQHKAPSLQQPNKESVVPVNDPNVRIVIDDQLQPVKQNKQTDQDYWNLISTAPLTNTAGAGKTTYVGAAGGTAVGIATTTSSKLSQQTVSVSVSTKGTATARKSARTGTGTATAARANPASDLLSSALQNVFQPGELEGEYRSAETGGATTSNAPGTSAAFSARAPAFSTSELRSDAVHNIIRSGELDSSDE